MTECDARVTDCCTARSAGGRCSSRWKLQAAAWRWGLNDGDRVVVYDDNEGVPAARAWWLLRRHGVDVRVLDGGVRAWVRAGFRLQRSDAAPRRGQISLTDAAGADVASIDDAATAPQRGVLIDARAPQHYRGTVPGSRCC